MTDPVISCPHCGREIKLTETLAQPFIAATREQFEAKARERESALAQRESGLRDAQAAVTKAKEEIDAQVAVKVKAERAAIAADEAKKARESLADELAKAKQSQTATEELLKDRDNKLAGAQKKELDLLRQKRELDDAMRTLELSVETKLQEQLTKLREDTRKEIEDQNRLKLAEREKTISDLQTQLQDALRKADQRSQQQQGEVQELELEALLRSKFPIDSIEPVPKGEHGGDALHRVRGPLGQVCGTILWESKRTKNWSDLWLAKLRDDQRAAKAEIAVIVSQVMPKDCDTFNLIDGVWVTSYKCAIPVAVTLRFSLIELACVRAAGDGQQTKTEMIYQYLTGPRFRHRIEAIVEKFSDMEDDLKKERTTMTRLWAKREEQIRGVIESTAGMYGDLQGIAGKTLQEIEGLNVKLLENTTPKS